MYDRIYDPFLYFYTERFHSRGMKQIYETIQKKTHVGRVQPLTFVSILILHFRNEEKKKKIVSPRQWQINDVRERRVWVGVQFPQGEKLTKFKVHPPPSLPPPRIVAGVWHKPSNFYATWSADGSFNSIQFHLAEPRDENERRNLKSAHALLKRKRIEFPRVGIFYFYFCQAWTRVIWTDRTWMRSRRMIRQSEGNTSMISSHF